MARRGHLALQIPPGPPAGPDKCPALLISLTLLPALPQTCVHTGVHSSLEIKGGEPHSLPLTQLNWMHQDNSELLGPPAGSPVLWPLLGHF